MASLLVVSIHASFWRSFDNRPVFDVVVVAVIIFRLIHCTKVVIIDATPTGSDNATSLVGTCFYRPYSSCLSR